MAHREAPSNAATVIIGQRVRAESSRSSKRGRTEINAAAAHYPGFLGAEIAPPTWCNPTGSWCTASTPSPICRRGSTARPGRIGCDRGSSTSTGPATQQVSSAARPRRRIQLVTVVVTHRVRPENVDDFLDVAEPTAAGGEQVRGLSRQPNCSARSRGSRTSGPRCTATTTPRTSTAWLTSDKRQATSSPRAQKFHDFKLRTVDNSFGSWFAFDEKGNEAPPPSDTKTSIAVWVGLYPTVVLLTLALSPLKMPLWLGLLVGNLLSSFVMSFVTMPYYVNPLLKHWLRPPADEPAARTNLRAMAIVAVVMAFWVVSSTS